MKLLLVQKNAELIQKTTKNTEESEENKMEKRNLVVAKDEMEIVDGKVMISSEELAAAIQDYDVDVDAEEEDNLKIHISVIIES